MEAAPGATALTGEQREALVAEKQKKLEEYRKQAGQSAARTRIWRWRIANRGRRYRGGASRRARTPCPARR